MYITSQNPSIIANISHLSFSLPTYLLHHTKCLNLPPPPRLWPLCSHHLWLSPLRDSLRWQGFHRCLDHTCRSLDFWPRHDLDTPREWSVCWNWNCGDFWLWNNVAVRWKSGSCLLFSYFPFSIFWFWPRNASAPGEGCGVMSAQFHVTFLVCRFPSPALFSLCPLIYLENYSSSPACDSARMEKDLIGRERKITFLHYSKLWTNVIHILKKKERWGNRLTGKSSAIYIMFPIFLSENSVHVLYLM